MKIYLPMQRKDNRLIAPNRRICAMEIHIKYVEKKNICTKTKYIEIAKFSFFPN